MCMKCTKSIRSIYRSISEDIQRYSALKYVASFVKRVAFLRTTDNIVLLYFQRCFEYSFVPLCRETATMSTHFCLLLSRWTVAQCCRKCWKRSVCGCARRWRSYSIWHRDCWLIPLLPQIRSSFHYKWLQPRETFWRYTSIRSQCGDLYFHSITKAFLIDARRFLTYMLAWDFWNFIPWFTDIRIFWWKQNRGGPYNHSYNA